MGVTKMSGDTEEVGLQCFLSNISVWVDLFDTKLNRALATLEDFEDGGARVFLTVFARLKGDGRLEQRVASCRGCGGGGWKW